MSSIDLIILLQFVDKQMGLEMLQNLRHYFEKGQEDLDRNIAELDNASLWGRNQSTSKGLMSQPCPKLMNPSGMPWS